MGVTAHGAQGSGLIIIEKMQNKCVRRFNDDTASQSLQPCPLLSVVYICEKH